MKVSALGYVIVCTAAVGACASVPDIAPDFSVPTGEIILHTVCELRSAFRYMQDNTVAYPDFKADAWAIGLTLTPKTDAESSLRAGLTGKSSSVAVAYLNSWIAGAGPGAEYDSHGTMTASAKYALSSKKLLARKTPASHDYEHELKCKVDDPSYNALTKHLGIQEWLKRAVSAGHLDNLTAVDNPTFTAEIVVKLDGSGSFTYTFPFGTDFIGFMGSYFVDDKLEIALTRNPEPVNLSSARLLPVNGQQNTGAKLITFVGEAAPTPSGLSAAARSKLENLQLEQTIRNLQITVPNRR